VKILVYVEGPSDRSALSAILRSIVDRGRKNGVGISFHPLGGKDVLLRKVARKAALYLSENPGDWVYALPDLYPMKKYDGTQFAHRNVHDLDLVLRQRFSQDAKELMVESFAQAHFRVRCLKYDLEALVLASRQQLKERLGTRDALRGQWRNPVEDQNDEKPPKRVVEELFRRYKSQDYIDTVDATWILERAPVEEVVRECSQEFAPFVREVEKLCRRP